MFRFLWVFSLALLPVMPAAAAVSGYYSSLDQINTVLSDSRLADLLGQAPVIAITEGESHGEAIEWRVKSERCTVSVWLLAVFPQGGIGKTSFEVAKIGKCKK